MGVTQGELSWERGSGWDEGLGFARFGAPGKTPCRVTGETLGKMGKAWTLMGKKRGEVSTEHRISGGRHAGKEESKRSKMQRNWVGRAGFHVPVGAQSWTVLSRSRECAVG